MTFLFTLIDRRMKRRRSTGCERMTILHFQIICNVYTLLSLGVSRRERSTHRKQERNEHEVGSIRKP